MTVPVTIAWDIRDADETYVVDVQPTDGTRIEIETANSRCVIHVPMNTLTRVSLWRHHGMLVTFPSEVIDVYAARW